MLEREEKYKASCAMRQRFCQYVRLCLTLLVFFSGQADCSANMPVKWNQRYQTYIDTYRDLAIYEMLQYNIPASITLAQGLLESGAGNSTLSRKGNNHFGIKCHGWTGRTMHQDDDEEGECFRVYDSPFDSYEDHSLFLLRPRYKRLFSLRRTDYVGWAKGLKECGYATNPRYAQLLIDIIRCYNLNVLDKETRYDASNIRKAGAGKPQADMPKRFKHHTAQVRQHTVRMNNKNYYVVARGGDTFKSIAEEFDLSYSKIAGYNERRKDDVLSAGDIVYLEKKKKKADKAFKKTPHTVQPGESMYSIAQLYGIRLKSLYKKNRLTPDYELRVGDRLVVY